MWERGEGVKRLYVDMKGFNLCSLNFFCGGGLFLGWFVMLLVFFEFCWLFWICSFEFLEVVVLFGVRMDFGYISF